MMLEQSNQPYRLRWDPLVIIAGEHERFFSLYQGATSYTVLDFLGFRQENPDSIVKCISNARENARTIRDRISRDMWEDLTGCFTRSAAIAWPRSSLRDRIVSAI